MESIDDETSLPTAIQPELPTFSEWISALLGFNIALPTLKLPQTFKNTDKALAGLVLASGDNVKKRIENNTKSLNEKSNVSRNIIRAGGKIALEQLSDDADLADRAACFATNDILRKQSNRERIARFAISSLYEDPSIENGEPISADWISQFADLAANKSEDDVQAIWGKILAGEIRQPGSFPLRFLAFLSTIDHALALKISRILKYVINSTFIFHPIGINSSYRENQDLCFDAIMEMEEAGILSGAAGLYGEFLKDHSEVESQETMILRLKFGNKELCFRIPNNQEMMGGYPITQMGRRLLSVIRPDEPPESYLLEINEMATSNAWEIVDCQSAMNK